jgi:hypothetical protein
VPPFNATVELAGPRFPEVVAGPAIRLWDVPGIRNQVVRSGDYLEAGPRCLINKTAERTPQERI